MFKGRVNGWSGAHSHSRLFGLGFRGWRVLTRTDARTNAAGTPRLGSKVGRRRRDSFGFGRKRSAGSAAL
eukprot:13315884-Ditylum_brightwellii.AAC.2